MIGSCEISRLRTNKKNKNLFLVLSEDVPYTDRTDII
jgi:hypothetical protein